MGRCRPYPDPRTASGSCAHWVLVASLALSGSLPESQAPVPTSSAAVELSCPGSGPAPLGSQP